MTQSLRLFLSTEHACGYLPGLLARSAFVDPEAGLGPAHYQRLLELGFRRSGDHTYRPHCRECTRCIPVRIDVGTGDPFYRDVQDYVDGFPDDADVTSTFEPGGHTFGFWRRMLPAQLEFVGERV